MDSLSELRTFVHVAETRSFVEAGRRLGISASAVGKSIARLEQHFGVPLFHRTTRSVSLTEDGRRLLVHGQRILDEVQATELDIAAAGHTPRGRLRVALPTATAFFSPLLSEFGRLHPRIALDVAFDDRLVDIVQEGFDVAVRTGEQHDSRLSVRRLSSFRSVIVAAPRYLAEAPKLLTPPDLTAHRVLLYKKPHTGKSEPWPVSFEGKAIDVDAIGGTIANAIDALVLMAIEGSGLACVPDYFVRSDLQSGRLVRVLEPFTRGGNAFHLLWPSKAQLAPRLRAFIDFMTARLPRSLEFGDAEAARGRPRARRR
ncbi:MAG: Transcriptional regulator, LysR family protein [Labilithrix sp.]|nr:Transcriptional regulator, LysR family protein [Labilithrix sp.]